MYSIYLIYFYLIFNFGQKYSNILISILYREKLAVSQQIIFNKSVIT